MEERGLLRVGASRLACVGMLLALAFGCRTPPPILKPPAGPEELNKPPIGDRYDKLEWPEECLKETNPRKGLAAKEDPFKNGAPTSNTGMQQTGGFKP